MLNKLQDLLMIASDLLLCGAFKLTFGQNKVVIEPVQEFLRNLAGFHSFTLGTWPCLHHYHLFIFFCN